MHRLLTGLCAALVAALILGLVACSERDGKPKAPSPDAAQTQQTTENAMGYEVQKSEEEWRAELTDAEYRVLREKGTERPFTSRLNDVTEEGTFLCAACGQEVFHSEHKFKSGTGWPSFYKPVDEGNVGEHPDNSFFMRRTEVVCGRCGSHLGHVFEDGPEPTGLRYCINGVALDFRPAGEGETE